MGNSTSFEETKNAIHDKVEEEIARRMMLQREIQMAVNVARARDNIHIFGSLWLTLTTGVSVAKLAGRSVPHIAGVPIVVGGILLGNLADMAYGNKLARINKEAAYLLENERARFVPFPQAPFARFYSAGERAIFYDKATAVGDLAPFSMVSRSFVPKES
mmetsp:Transcript_85787/g.128527  ORF Transcript_85787/g.128527 Transcript_85787/m.128527 type:complete len:160 (-) Transcript_85787:132-611(-)|eukprot:CAMPEP_0117050626 /NCGR_PEP_ID=MMETSP0472-20121206/34961_1 /TAXON_ID=693140 ORGANISM="Tiarina fusus, Strain LIS" /NCGR_SAMPLE_ID=MMETSP0472 /ASSEMBLY_ACC=CAM_ASM_000603 /LENGTH=159 /DNA_ID=CAMNT_0004764493 /DNA_START=245 /DNA_END=724 /DNA_ORIENTATION=+